MLKICERGRDLHQEFISDRMVRCHRDEILYDPDTDEDDILHSAQPATDVFKLEPYSGRIIISSVSRAVDQLYKN